MITNLTPLKKNGLAQKYIRAKFTNLTPLEKMETPKSSSSSFLREGRITFLAEVTGSQAKHDGFESWSRHVISLSKEFTHIAQANSAFYLSLIHISEPTRRTPISYAV